MSKITIGVRNILQSFINWLPEGANKSSSTDQGHVSKTSPTLFEYDVFRINWEKVPMLREIDLMIRSDPRLKRANHVFASTAVRRGLSIKVTSELDEQLAKRAQELIDEMMRGAQINSKLRPWARSLLKDGELFLNPIIDVKQKKILDIKNLPAITMHRNEDITGRFPDIKKAFSQIDPITPNLVLHDFPLFSINHIRYDHESGQLYGNSQYLACRASWKKLYMTEEDLVVRRRTRAVPRRLHSVGNKDNPSDWTEIQKYKETNKLDTAKNAAVTTDYFGNGLTDIKDLNGDALLDHIKDIEHVQEVMMIGTGVPLHILGFGRNVNRDIVEDQKKQFEEDTQELRDLLEYGDEAPFSGLRSICDLQLILQGIDPSLVSYNFMWAEADNQEVDKKVDRVIKMRAAQPDPLVSRKFALTYLGRDIGLENEDAVLAEIEAIIEEMDEAKQEQETEATMLNPEKPATSPTNKSTAQSSGRPVKDSIENPLHSKKVVRLEKQFANETRKFFKSVFRTMKNNGLEASIEKIGKLRSIHDSVSTYNMDEDALSLMNPHQGCSCTQCMLDKQNEVKLSDLVEQHVIDELDAAWDENSEYIKGKLTAHYLTMGEMSFDMVGEQIQSGISLNFVHSGVKQDLEFAAADRIDGIKETTKQLLRKELAEAYENAENVDQWVERIGKVMNIPDWRAETIARSELAWAFNKANMTAYSEAGVIKVKWLTVLDNRTCPTCRGHNDKEFNLSELPAIPAHPRCRCTTVAIL